MKKTKNCKFCYDIFESRRSNHVYCSASCKTKASYQRNDYKYVSGHYKKTEALVEQKDELLPTTNEVLESIKELDLKISSLKPIPPINVNSIANAAIGTATTDASVFMAKKLFAPNTLPATKGDIQKLKNDLFELKQLIEGRNSQIDSFGI